MSLTDFLLHSDGVSRVLALALLVLSVGSWVVMLWKWRLLSRVGHDVARSMAAFWQAPTFEERVSVSRSSTAMLAWRRCLKPLCCQWAAHWPRLAIGIPN